MIVYRDSSKYVLSKRALSTSEAGAMMKDVWDAALFERLYAVKEAGRMFLKNEAR